MSETRDTPEATNHTTSSAPVHSVRRLTRREDGKLIAGVASGLGDYTGVDPVIFRIAFIVLTVAGGVGILLYLVGWLMIPSRTSNRSVGEQVIDRRTRRGSAVLGVVLLVVGALWILGDLGLWNDGGDWEQVAWGIALVAIGVILLRDEGDGGRNDSGHDQAIAPAVSAGSGPASATTVVAPATTESQRRRRTKSYLGRLTLGSALVILGGMAVLDNLGAFDASLDDYLAIALVVVGGGLVVGGWRGRSRGLIVIGIFLLPLLFVASLIDVPLQGGMGERFYRPTSAADAARDYRLGAGTLEIDLGALAEEPDPVRVSASVGAGSIAVTVPPGVHAMVAAHAGAGHIQVFGRTQDGLDVNLDHSTGDSSAGTMVLDLDIGLGEVVVDRSHGGTP